MKRSCQVKGGQVWQCDKSELLGHSEGGQVWQCDKSELLGHSEVPDCPFARPDPGPLTFAEIGDGTHYQFDALGRTLVVGKNSELGMLYSGFNYNSGFVTEQVDARGNPTYFSYQAFDQPMQDSIVNISAPLGVNTAIARDNFGKAMSIIKSGGGKNATRTYIYDANERLCKTIEPETAGTIQQYDWYNAVAWKAVGQSTAASCDPATVLASAKTNFAYDHMNRLTTTTFGDGKPSISRTYTKDDLLETISSDGSVWTNVYNTRRQLKSETVTFGGATYAIQRGYDANANLASITYPGTGTNNVVDYAPNGLGEPSKAGTFATNVTYHPNGAIKGFTYGNGIVHTMTQNARGLPERSTDDSGVLNDAYTYDANANVASIADDQMGVTTRTMTYDALDRLETVSAPNLWGIATYGYDSLDNITSSSITGGSTARVSTHIYNATTNLLSSTSSNVPGYTQSYGYDTRGNITSRGSQGFKFDLANRMYEATLKATYKYDGFGRRISTVGTDSVNRITVYSQDGKVMYGATSGASTGTKYIYLHDHLIAESSPSYTEYTHADGLGSPVAITNDTKAIVSRTRYEPYGLVSSGTNPSIGYTGHVNVPDTGLVYMQQRYYDPVSGRFLSIDPVLTDNSTGASFNRYNYADNNPYANVDPDGRESAPVQTVTITAPRPAPIIVWVPIESSRRVDPLAKPWVSQMGSSTGTPGFDPDDDDEDPRGRSRGSRSRTGKSDKHGDREAVAKAQKEIDKLTEQAKQAPSRKERMKIEKKIQNIRETAQRRAKGETHWMK